MEEHRELGCIKKKVYFNLLWIIFSLIFVWFLIWAKGIDIAREIEVKCDYFMINFAGIMVKMQTLDDALINDSMNKMERAHLTKLPKHFL